MTTVTVCSTNPMATHLEAAMHVLRYLKGSRHYCIVYTSGTPGSSTWCVILTQIGAQMRTTRSHTQGTQSRFMVIPLPGHGTTKQRLQNSTMESEYMALCDGSRKLSHERNKLRSDHFRVAGGNATRRIRSPDCYIMCLDTYPWFSIFISFLAMANASFPKAVLADRLAPCLSSTGMASGFSTNIARYTGVYPSICR